MHADQGPQVVAVKQIKLSTPGAASAFEREGHVLRTLSGKRYTAAFHSVHLPSADVTEKQLDGHAYLVME